MKKIALYITLLAVLLSASPSFAVSVTVSPQLLEKAIGLYPEQKGPFELRYRADLRMQELGFQIITYTFLSEGQETGYVTRVTSVMPQDSEDYFDVLMRIDAGKKIMNAADLVQPLRTGKPKQSTDEVRPEGPDAREALLNYLKGKDAGEYKDALTVLINGLATGANLRDVDPLPPPPKDLVLDTTGKIMLPGESLPVVKATDLQGKLFSTEKMKGKVIMVFTTPTCAVCDGMILALEKGLDLSQKRNAVTLAYVVGAEAPEAKDYLARLKAKGTGIAEPGDAITKALKVPFRPYILMFENGKLKYNFIWEDDESKLFGFLYLLIEGKEPEGEDA